MNFEELRMVTIRLARGGRPHKPVFTIVATDARYCRDGRFLAKLGQYNPQKAEKSLVDVDTEALRAWIDKGATISDTVRTLLKKNSIKF